MFSRVSEHFEKRLTDTPIEQSPYPHLFIENVFPNDFYHFLLNNTPDNNKLKTLTSLGRVGASYPTSRKIVKLEKESLESFDGEVYSGFWNRLSDWMASPQFYKPVISKFNPLIKERFNNDLSKIKLVPETLYVQDETSYSLGPHSDAESKVITLLFYLPKDDSMKKWGTSMYVPKDPNFKCVGGPHHSFDKFNLLKTMPFIPNSMFGFFKTDNSFHGVEPVTDPIRRDLLLYDVKYKKIS